MPVEKDELGNRFVQVEVEVPGTPEQVWDAIATGPGVSAWFVPTSVEERVGGAVLASFGPGMDSVSTITEWDPPAKFVAESRDDMGPGDPTIATEWTVEAKSGDTCVVRVVHRWFADSDKWDKQLEGYEGGWPGFFRILRIYLTYFPGQKSKAFQVTGFAAEPKSEAWKSLTDKLGLPAASKVGDTIASSHETLHLEGTVENVGESDHSELMLLKVDKPFTGVAHLFAMPMGGPVIISLSFYLFGDDAEAKAAEEQPKWAAFISENFPMGEGFDPTC
jgi:uncharacterized protein YndB with AHSA1/START domain